MFKVKNKGSRTTPLACSGVFIVNFEHISHIIQVFLLLILNMWLPAADDSWCLVIQLVEMEVSAILTNCKLRNTST